MIIQSDDGHHWAKLKESSDGIKVTIFRRNRCDGSDKTIEHMIHEDVIDASLHWVADHILNEVLNKLDWRGRK